MNPMPDYPSPIVEIHLPKPVKYTDEGKRDQADGQAGMGQDAEQGVAADQALALEQGHDQRDGDGRGGNAERRTEWPL